MTGTKTAALAGLALLLSGVALHTVVAQPATPGTPAPTVISACTGIDEATCGRSEGCTWLPGFKVPDKQDVPGYCRPSPRSLKARRGTGPGTEPPKQ